MSIARTVSSLAAVALALSTTAANAQTAPLTLKVHHADADSFNVNAVLVAGKTDAVLFDAGFTRADALRIAAMVLDSRKTLKTIYISQPDPDYYFGIDILKSYFPDAKVVATAATVKKIEATLPTKLGFWPSKMGMFINSRHRSTADHHGPAAGPPRAGPSFRPDRVPPAGRCPSSPSEWCRSRPRRRPLRPGA